MRETELALPAPPRIAESGLGLVKPARLLRLTRQAGGALWSQKGKAFLMMLGTAVGIMLLTAVVGLSAGVEKRINEIMTAFGPRSVMIWAGGGQMHGPGDRSASSSTMKLDDVAAIEEEISDRFGPPPKSVLNLCRYGRIKLLARRLKVTSVDRTGDRVVFKFLPSTDAQLGRMTALLNRYAGTLTPQGVMSLRVGARSDAELLDETIAVLKAL